LNHFASPDFWYHYRVLPADVQQLADRCFLLMNSNPRHPSIHLKKASEFWSARVGLHWRAVGVEVENGISWFWIGSHAEYDKIIG
jgi:hypothetical protein